MRLSILFRPLRLKSPSPIKTTSDRNESPPSTVPPQLTNGHHPSSNNSLKEPETIVIENGLSNDHIDDEIDNDDGQWSDWEHNPDPPEPSINYSEALPSSPPTLIEEPITSKPTTTSLKSLKLNNISKPKWNPNAPLGSEYEIPPVILKKTKSTKVETSTNQDQDDFFKDMTPKVETVELMRQLETMFNVNTDNNLNQQIKSSASVSNKFGIMSQDHDDNKEIESGNNNWDE